MRPMQRSPDRLNSKYQIEDRPEACSPPSLEPWTLIDPEEPGQKQEWPARTSRACRMRCVCHLSLTSVLRRWHCFYTQRKLNCREKTLHTLRRVSLLPSATQSTAQHRSTNTTQQHHVAALHTAIAAVDSTRRCLA